jgi:hypothetical protein
MTAILVMCGHLMTEGFTVSKRCVRCGPRLPRQSVRDAKHCQDHRRIELAKTDNPTQLSRSRIPSRAQEGTVKPKLQNAVDPVTRDVDALPGSRHAPLLL